MILSALLVLTLTTARYLLQPDIEETAMITMDFGGTKAYAFESWLMPAYGKQRDLVVVGFREDRRDRLPQTPGAPDLRHAAAEQDFDGKTAFKCRERGVVHHTNNLRRAAKRRASSLHPVRER